jgi:hypothetical protein
MAETKTPELVKRVVTALFATYTTVRADLVGNPREVVLTADRGELIELPQIEADRLEALDAVAPEGVAVHDDAARRAALLDAYRAERGDSEALERALARAVNPLDVQQPATSVQQSVTSPGLGAAPVGTVVTGDTGAADDQPPADTTPEGGTGAVRADAPDVRAIEVGGLAEWIKSERPNGDDTVALAEGDAELAAKVLEAERVATGNDPRKGVERKLTALADTSGGDE